MSEQVAEQLLVPCNEQLISMETDEDFKQAEYTVLFNGNVAEGVRFEDLKRVKVLGEGMSGYVEKCVHVPSQKFVAVKVIALTGNTTVNQQIKSELKVLHECVCPNVISSYGAYIHEGTVKIALEYMDAGTLQDIMKRIGPIPEVILGLIAHQALKGLEYLHKVQRVIHRDIKPSNILLNSEGYVKIADFGISGCFENSLEGKLSYVGTLCYMAVIYRIKNSLRDLIMRSTFLIVIYGV
jgi:serine/threonine protein kinase